MAYSTTGRGAGGLKTKKGRSERIGKIRSGPKKTFQRKGHEGTKG